MELTSDKLTMLENKIIMMYVLEKPKKPISYKVYLELVTSLAEINFFDFHQLLQSLLKDDYIQSFQEDRKIEKRNYNINIDEANRIKEEYKKNSAFKKYFITEEESDVIEAQENNISNEPTKIDEIEDNEIESEILIDDGIKTFNFLDENIKENERIEKITLYHLTQKGKEALSLSISTLPGITKLRIDADFNKYYKIIREAYSVLAEYIPKKDLVICKIVENYQEIFKMEVIVGSIEQAKNIVKNWKARADEYYLDILKNLSEE